MIRYILRLLSLGAGLYLAWQGARATTEQSWRLYLGGIALLLLLALWPARPPKQEGGLGHNVRKLGAFFFVLALLLALHLLWLQVWQGPAIRRRVADLPDGAVEDVRPMIAERRTRRGRIYDRDGELLADIEITPEDWVRRVYAQDNLGHIVGFYNPLYGNAGLEASFNDYLAGQLDGDPWEEFLEDLLHHPHRGNDLYLTLDMDLQRAAEEALGEEYGAIVLLDTRTGAILALAANPRFDPRPMVFDPGAEDWEVEQARVERYWQQLNGSTDALLVNRATAGLYPPGSTFKTLTAAIALEAGLVRPDTHISCPNELVVTGHTIVNFMDDLAETLMEREDLLEDYQYSCNTAFAQLGLIIGPDLYSEYAQRFGLTYANLPPPQSPDFVELPTAASTIAQSRAFLDRETGLADTAFGQGQLSITPLYLAMLSATMANDGTMMRPYLVERVVSPEGETLHQAQPIPLRVPIGVRTARTMQRLMTVSGVEGFGWRAQFEGTTVASKTGTAETGEGLPHAVFIAYAPAETPRYAISVLVEHGDSGAQTCAPLAKIVLQAAVEE
ncbi:MAG: penicillin-binding protein 2 [Chloroflexia bacterium]|nr:penicillin-binding protein 2 [Chloroflexia bacterium]